MFKLLFFTTTLLFSLNSHAQQAETFSDAIRWQAKIKEVKTFPEDGNGIPFLEWMHESIVVESAGNLQHTDIRGFFKSKVIRGTLNAKPLFIKKDGTFDIHFGFTGDTKTFIITATDSKNNIYRMHYQIVPYDSRDERVPSSSNWRFSLGTGITRLNYNQTNAFPFHEYAVTVKGSVLYRLIPEALDCSLSSFYNVAALNTSSPAGFKLQYLGVNARLGYHLIEAPSSIRVNINGGFYYNTSFSTIGFANMYGPQLYPEFIYVLDNGNSIMLYAKFSPALSQAKSLSFTENREIATGMHYSFPISRVLRMSVGLDISAFNLSVPGNTASTSTYSLSTGISF